jgi:hypothetical protein
VEWYSLLTGQALQAVLEGASYIVCRGGYTTLMDAALLGLKLILIPTPGQGEQQYLGRLYGTMGRGICISQSGFQLQEVLSKAAQFPFTPLLPTGSKTDGFKPVLEAWYNNLKA